MPPTAIFPHANLLHAADVGMTTPVVSVASLCSTVEHTRCPGASIEVKENRGEQSQDACVIRDHCDVHGTGVVGSADGLQADQPGG